MITSSKEAKNWYLASSFNRDALTNNESIKFAKSYQLACTIPQEIINTLLPNISGKYLGSNLLVVNFLNPENTVYLLLFYTGDYVPDFKQYVVGYGFFGLTDYTVDYKPYLNSKKYVPLNTLKKENIILDTAYFYQGYSQKVKSCLTSGSLGTQIYNFEGDKVRNTYSRFQTYNDRVIYYSSTRNYFSLTDKTDYFNLYQISTYYEKFCSRTPSTWDFGYSLMYQLNKLSQQTANKKEIKNKREVDYKSDLISQLGKNINKKNTKNKK